VFLSTEVPINSAAPYWHPVLTKAILGPALASQTHVRYEYFMGLLTNVGALKLIYTLSQFEIPFQK
jgi:hypothetical protein